MADETPSKDKQGFNSAYAWRYLSRAQKEKLEELRRAGMIEVGGMGFKAPYFYVQEGSEPEMAASAQKVGITPKKFVRTALEEGRLRPEEIYDILSST